MESEQLVELVVIEEGSDGEAELFVLSWEYDRANNKIMYLKLFHYDDWRAGRRDHPAYIAPKGNLILFQRDPSGYISTSNRLRSHQENGKWYDEYGRCYTKRQDNLRLSDLRLKPFRLDSLDRLGKEEVKKRIFDGQPFPLNGINPSSPNMSMGEPLSG